MNTKALLTAALLAVLSLTSKAQTTGYLPGYIITPSNDTIRGFVKQGGINIKFKRSKKAKAEVFPPEKLIGFYVGEKVFETVRVPPRSEGFNGYDEYLELVVDGPMKLYREVTWSFSSQFGTKSHTAYYILRREDKKVTEILNLEFRKTVAAALADNQDLVKKINAGVYKKRDIELIVSDYNSWKANQ